MDNNYAMLCPKQLSNNANNAYAYAFNINVFLFILIYVKYYLNIAKETKKQFFLNNKIAILIFVYKEIRKNYAQKKYEFEEIKINGISERITYFKLKI